MRAPFAVIPARYSASRFPGKPLTLLAGTPMVAHVVDRCLEAKCFSEVCVATDDERIAAAVRSRCRVVMTSPDCPSGTDRVAEAARQLGLQSDEVMVNVQGDEPAVHPDALRLLAGSFSDATVEMATLVRPIRAEERGNPNVVKAVLDERGRALYFSRADLPFARTDDPSMPRYAHLGLYGYRASTLQRLATLAPTALERTESLEQLRALGHGISILCRVTTYESQAVDRPEDVPAAEAALRRLRG